MSCSHFQQGDTQPLDAQIECADNDLLLVDATGSVGNEVIVQIIRNGKPIETTPAEINNGNNQISITGPLENGDVICVVVSNDGFLTFDMDCLTIPTPAFGFVPIT
jgi:hypothetical protein